MNFEEEQGLLGKDCKVEMEDRNVVMILHQN